MTRREEYEAFLRRKAATSKSIGFEIEDAEIHPLLKPHQRICVIANVLAGRKADFLSFGLGKTVIQLETLRLILKYVEQQMLGCFPRDKYSPLPDAPNRGLVVAPLGVAEAVFIPDGEMLGIPVRFIRRIEECGPTGIYLTNYETVRDGKLDPAQFTVTTLDEAAILRGFGGTKTFREFMRLFDSVKYRFVATATPDPNEYIELLAYAAYLGIMDVGEAKTRFFKRDATKADVLTLHPHKAEEFWLWVASWALFIQKPSDLGFDDTGYALPPMTVNYHQVKYSGTECVDVERDGQVRMFRDSTLGVTQAAREKRDSLSARVACAKRIIDESPGDRFLLWHDLEQERKEIEQAIPEAVSVYGNQDLDDRERAIIAFSNGEIQHLAGKPVICGTGCNFQRYCHRAIFVGITFKFAEFIQAVHRVYRFLQTEEVIIDIIYSEGERTVLERLLEKWANYKIQVEKMAEIIREYGLSELALAQAMTRAMGVARVEVSSETYTLVNNDSIIEAPALEDSSVGLVLTSIPFSSQYEYTPSYNDFGHNDDNDAFFEQMDFLTPELLRVMIPGRCAAIHVKDRVVPGGINGMGVQSVYPFHAATITHFQKHGFLYMGMKTIVTDVVRENNQTYRLGWTEQCKDGTKMGYGMPEYLLLFRKPQTDKSKGYGDVRVVKDKRRYSKARWQVDAHGFARSNGNRPLTPQEIIDLPLAKDFHQKVFGMFHDFYSSHVYDFEQHVKMGEALEARGVLPVTFMLLQPPSWHPDVWTDITRMVTLNATQAAKGRMKHICLARGSLVLTKQRGYVPIQDVQVGEQALTHLGRWRKVLVVRKTGTAPAITVRAQGVPGLTLTPDHKLWARKSALVRERDGAEACKPSWLEAENSFRSYVNLKLPECEPENVEFRHWWIVGRWLADGCWGSRSQALLCIGYEKLETTLESLGDRAGAVNRLRTAAQVHILDPNATIREVLERCGTGASGKHIPPEAFTLPREQAASLLAGYLSGDGHLSTERSRMQATSVSRELLLGLAMVVQRVHGTIASVHAGRPARKSTIEGREVNCKQEWIMSFDVGDSHRSAPFVLKDGAWKKVRSLEDAGEVETWNLRVEEDESYTAEGCIVKNCPMQLDIADRVILQMSNEGDLVLDPFSGIGTVPMRAVALRRRAFGIELNSAYFLDSAAYCKAAEMQLGAPMLFDCLAEPEEAAVAV